MKLQVNETDWVSNSSTVTWWQEGTVTSSSVTHEHHSLLRLQRKWELEWEASRMQAGKPMWSNTDTQVGGGVPRVAPPTTTSCPVFQRTLRDRWIDFNESYGTHALWGQKWWQSCSRTISANFPLVWGRNRDFNGQCSQCTSLSKIPHCQPFPQLWG